MKTLLLSAVSACVFTFISMMTAHATQPALLAHTQTMNNETASPPAEPSQPWLTTAVRNITAAGAELALERSEVAAGSIVTVETVGVVAIEGGRTGSFTASDGQSVDYGAQVTEETIRGWNTCASTPLVGGVGADAVVVATPATHNGGDGGWLRRCAQTDNAIGLLFDEDTFYDTERGHIPERASLLAFSRPFNAALVDYDGGTWQLEAGEVTLNNTYANPNFVSVSFQQGYAQPPIVLVLPTSEGGNSASLRIRNVTTSGFEISQVEPANFDGPHVSMIVPYVVIEPGTHQFLDGTWVYADLLDIDQVQHGAGVTGVESWYDLSFPDIFTGSDPTVTAVVQEIVSDYSWGYKNGLKQPLGSYKNGRSIHAVSRRTRENPAEPREPPGSADFLVWVDEHTGEVLALEHPVGVLEDGVNPGGNATFTSDAPDGKDGRIWFVFGGRAHELPFDLARSSELFDPRDFDLVLDNFVTTGGSTAPTVSVVGQTGLLTYRFEGSVRLDGAVLFQRYDLEPETPWLETEEALGRPSFVQGLGDITIEQVWSRWDPRQGALAVSWSWFASQQDPVLFGSNPFLYTQDFGETWRLADGSQATLPLTYATVEPRISPYDHLALRESTSWWTRDVGFGPNGTPWISNVVDNDIRQVRFFLWNQYAWESRVLTDDLEGGDPLACGAARDYLVCAYSERGTPGTLLVRVSRDDGQNWSTPVAVDSVGKAPDGSVQRINWVSFVQPADRYLDNTARFFFSYYNPTDALGKIFMNNIRWIRVQVGPRTDFNGDQRVDMEDWIEFDSAFQQDDWRADFVDNGVVDDIDYYVFFEAWNEER